MQAPAYNRTKNFLENNPDRTDHGALNAELDKVALSIEGLRDNAVLLQKDDGTLQNSVVALVNLTPAAIAALQVPGPVGPVGAVGPAGPVGPQGVKGDVGSSFDADAKDVFANRSLYNLQPKGFSFLAIDTGNLYFKISATSGDWSPGFVYGKGDTGATGAVGATGPVGPQGLQGIQGPVGPVGAPGLILVMVQVSAGVSSYTAYLKLKRDSTDILLSDAAGNRARTTVVINPRDTQPERMNDTKPIVYLDSPNTTSSITYKVALACRGTGMAAYINRCDTDNNDYTYDARTTSTITVMEIAG